MRLINAILCDDVRTEAGGKHSLIGVYGDVVNIGIPQSAGPISQVGMKLCFFFTIRKERDEELPDAFTVSFRREGVEWPTVKGQMTKHDEMKRNDLLNIVIMLPGFPIGGEGRINCKLDFTLGNRVLHSIDTDGFSLVVQRT